jgi:hypothetical protein
LSGNIFNADLGNPGIVLLDDDIHCHTNEGRRSQIKKLIQNRTDYRLPKIVSIGSAVD